MLISNWSSDVCSSDLIQRSSGTRWNGCFLVKPPYSANTRLPPGRTTRSASISALRRDCTGSSCSSRSEEHTSELQSLMRISYAVFCLKKKKLYTTHNLLSIHIQKHPFSDQKHT